MDQYANLFLLYFLINFFLILILPLGYIAGLPKTRKEAVKAILSVVTTVDLFLIVGLINLYLGLVVSLVYVFTSNRYEEKVFAMFLTPLRSVIYILCLQLVSSVGTYLITKDIRLITTIGGFHIIYIALALYSFKLPTMEEWRKG